MRQPVAEVGKDLASNELGHLGCRCPGQPLTWLQARGNRRLHGGPGADWAFLLFQVALPEHMPAGSIILTVSATDPDSGSNGDVTFHLAVPSPDIAIDPSNGAWGWLLCGPIFWVAQQCLQREVPPSWPRLSPSPGRSVGWLVGQTWWCGHRALLLQRPRHLFLRSITLTAFPAPCWSPC